MTQNDAILSAQEIKLYEVAQLSWDSASELIAVEGPERATISQ